jgi:hypothetical protein
VTADAAARYAEPGYILFPRGGTLLAQRFDADGLRLVGEPVRLLDTVGRNIPTGYTALSVSGVGNRPTAKSRTPRRESSGGIAPAA